ncbi:MAG TPA: hypothetical protein VLV87_06245 [Gammaproteobacteria bacterium]|nr:hypothetical protein [Gammaproteobacteria bacterium]
MDVGLLGARVLGGAPGVPAGGQWVMPLGGRVCGGVVGAGFGLFGNAGFIGLLGPLGLPGVGAVGVVLGVVGAPVGCAKTATDAAPRTSPAKVVYRIRIVSS